MAGEKRFQATARKLRRARDDGDVAKSRDLTGAIALIAGSAWLFITAGNTDKLLRLFVDSFSVSGDFSSADVIASLLLAARVVLEMLWSFLFVVFFSVVIAEALQVGVQFSAKPLALKFSRLNLAQGLKRLCGFDGPENSPGLPTRLVFDIGKLTFYLIVLGAVFTFVLYQLTIQVLRGGYINEEELLLLIYYGSCFVIVGAIPLVCMMAVIDLILQRNRRQKRLRMDAEEFKKELKESEGAPELRGMRKQLHQEMLLHGLVQGVRKARVVVVGK